MPSLRIGQLATTTGVSIETLRYYEKEGLLQPQSRTDSGYRIYDTEAIQQISFILNAKAVGFTLKEIKELLSIRVNTDTRSCGDVKSVAQAKLLDIESKIYQLNKISNSPTTSI